MQEFTSAKTSRKQIDKVHRIIINKNLEEGKLCLDLGGGKYELNTDYFAKNEKCNMVLDKYNQSDELFSAYENVFKLLKKEGKGADFVIISNVLNVIKEDENKIEVLNIAKNYVKNGGNVYIGVYEGDKSGVGSQSVADCWQENKTLKQYLPIISQVFSDIKIKYGIIIAK